VSQLRSSFQKDRMQKFWLCIFPLSFFLQVATAQRAGSALDSVQKRIRTSFSGRVVQSSSGFPLQDATIYISDIKAGVATNNEGRFIMRNLPPGRHLVEVSFIGYSTISEYVDIKGDMQKDFVLSPEVAERNAVVITGSSSATQAKRIPTPITIVRRQELLRNGSMNIVDAISKQPGITQLSTGPAISKPVIRGLGYNRVVILNDGVRKEGKQCGAQPVLERD